MRIQYRTRPLFGFTTDAMWTPWGDLPAEPITTGFGFAEFRMVNDAGEAVQQTPAFTPAYYQFTSDGVTKGSLHWKESAPEPAEHWIRRDDVKPRGAQA